MKITHKNPKSMQKKCESVWNEFCWRCQSFYKSSNENYTKFCTTHVSLSQLNFDDVNQQKYRKKTAVQNRNKIYYTKIFKSTKDMQSCVSVIIAWKIFHLKAIKCCKLFDSNDDDSVDFILLEFFLLIANECIEYNLYFLRFYYFYINF